ncbi:unnamed protein product [Camellia sinensis]
MIFLKNLLYSLSLNSSVSNFYNTTTGNDQDTVFGLFLCYNFVSKDYCKNCIESASQDIQTLCGKRNEAVVWEENCQLRYANESFFGHLDVTGNIWKDNKQNVSGDEFGQFSSVVNDTLHNLSRLAAFNPSYGMYATGAVTFTDTKTIYALVQCTTDLSLDDCNTCLEIAIANTSSCCSESRGARLLSPSCYLRYEFYAFYEGATSENLRIFEKNQLYDNGDPNNIDVQHQNLQARDNLNSQNFPFFDLSTLSAATDNFSDSNKLGQGGFGLVYKGQLPDGKEVAVKRLSSVSEQGLDEFTNEVLLILKLQHKNLVRLLGFCIDGDEKDLKPINVLLDSEMNPKISDFGMARIFGGSDDATNTARIVGTYGYMAPEFAMEGLYSVKSDVLSFGVLSIEIITGRRNATIWQLWNEGKGLEMIDPLLMKSCDLDEFLRYMHIGLLCIQEDAYDRPTMSLVVVMLKSEAVTLSQPERPAFSRLFSVSEQGLDESMKHRYSKNSVVRVPGTYRLRVRIPVRRHAYRVRQKRINGDEKLLIYEYMPNGSLDVCLVDPRMRAHMNWSWRLNIINGIARGMLYLYEDSRLRIIHRDLKPSIVLLDSEMNPKISDFRMTSIFRGSDDATNTSKIVGTCGYMALEFAMEELYSVKSDVFSFGVLLIEIITGRRNASFHLTKCAPSLIAYVSLFDLI